MGERVGGGEGGGQISFKTTNIFSNLMGGEVNIGWEHVKVFLGVE